MACEAVARAFHEAYEELAPHYDYETRRESAKPWDDVPENNRLLMTATIELVARESPELLRALLDG